MPKRSTTHPLTRLRALVLLCVASLAAVTCKLDTLTGPTAGVGVPAVSITGDSVVALGATTHLATQITLAGVSSSIPVTWSTGNASVATVDAQSGVVTAISVGTAVITATVVAQEVATSPFATYSVRVRYDGLTVQPVPALTSIGDSATLLAQWTDTQGTPLAAVESDQIVFTTADTAVAAIVNGNVLVARRNGTARVVATTSTDALVDSTTVTVRQTPAHLSFGGATQLDVGSLGVDRKIAVTATDARNVSIPPTVAGITWTSSKRSIVTIDSATGVLRGVGVGTADVTASGGGHAQTIPVHVQQVPASILRTAGDSQSVIAGSAVATAPVVTVVDSGGAGVPNTNVSFTAANGGAVAGSPQVTDAKGRAAPASWTLGARAGADTLTASAAGLSATFVAQGTPGAVVQLVFTSGPVSTAVGASLSRVAVAAADANGNPVTSGSGTVTLSLDVNPSSATLGGTVSAALVDGVATFDDLTVSAAGNGYTLAASAPGLTSASSDAFNVFGGAAQLAFLSEPGSTSVTAPLSPAIRVAVQDANGSVVSTANDVVRLTLGANPGGGTLGGTVSVAAVDGVATFTGLSIGSPGVGYTLAATAPGLGSATSAAFDVTSVGAPSVLSFIAQPASAAAGATLAGISVAVQDAHGATITTSNAAISLALTSPGRSGLALGGTLTRNAVNGVAVFPDITLQSAGTGYTIAATATVFGSLLQGTSSSFDIAPAAATALHFTSQPGNVGVGDRVTPSVAVAVTDAFGNVVTGATDAVTVALETGSGAAATLGGTLTVNAANGLASFGDLVVSAEGQGFRLLATHPGLTQDTSAPFNVAAAGAATRLAFIVQPTSGTSAATLPPVEVALQDDKGKTVPTNGTVITLSVTSSAASDTLGGTLTAITTDGIAQFSDLVLKRASAGYQLVASGDGLDPARSNSFSVAAGAPAQLIVTSPPPASVPATTAMTPSLAIGIADAAGNLVTSSTASVTASLVVPAGVTAVLGGTVTTAAVAGVATFNDLTIDKPAAGLSIAASSPGLTGVSTRTFDVGGTVATRLTFVGVDPSVIAHAPTSYTVAIVDADGNVVENATNTITVSLSAGPSGALLTGTTTLNAVNGKATFPDLTLSEVGSGYILTATSPGLAAAATSSLDATFSTQSVMLQFAAPPVTTPVGQSLPTMQVAVVDPFGNVITTAAPTTISLFLDAASPNGGTLGGTLEQTTAAGIATFTGVTLGPIGAGYKLDASASGFTHAVSPAFDITGGDHLVFTTQPSSVSAASHILPAVQVAVSDASSATVSGATNLVTIALVDGHGTQGSTLSGTLTRAAVNGVATFDDLALDSAGTGYELTASSNGLAAATSADFDVLASGSARLVFRVQPTDLAPHQAFVPLQVAITDDQGNLVTSATDAVTLSILAGTGASGAALDGTVTQAAVNGIATFAGVSVSLASATAYRLQASAPGLITASSNTFVAQDGPPVRLAFSAQPATTAKSAPFAADIQVTLTDSAGNVSSSATDAVTLAITSGTGTPGAALTGSLTANAVNGIATFHGNSIDQLGAGYTLTASATGLQSAVSDSFDVIAIPVSLHFFVQPANATGGSLLAPAVQVEELDSDGNRVATAGDSVFLSLVSSDSGTLTGTTRVQAVNGVATFADLSVDKIGTYVLAAASQGLTGANSDGFTVSPGAPDHLIIAAGSNSLYLNGPVTAATPGAMGDVVVHEVDRAGNLVTTASDPITISLSTSVGPQDATLSGTTTINAVNGVATFSDLTVDKVGTYQWDVVAPGLPDAGGGQFTIVPGAATHLAFGVSPKSTFLNAPLNPDSSLTVEVLDGGNNVVTGSSDVIVLSVASSPGVYVLQGTPTVQAINGVATIPASVTISGTDGTYTITAQDNSTTLTAATSAPFTVAAFSTPSQLVWTVEPSDVTVSTTPAVAPQVAVEDQYGNIVTTSTDSIALTLSPNPGGANLANGGARAVNGVATFSGLLIDAAGSNVGYTATDVTDGGLAAVNSSSFNVGSFSLASRDSGQGTAVWRVRRGVR